MSTNKGKDIIVEVTQEEYDKQIDSGLTEDEILKPGRHVFRRGGFRERHPNFDLKNVKVKTTNSEQSAPLAEDGKEKKAA